MLFVRVSSDYSQLDSSISFLFQFIFFLFLFRWNENVKRDFSSWYEQCKQKNRFWENKIFIIPCKSHEYRGKQYCAIRSPDNSFSRGFRAERIERGNE